MKKIVTASILSGILLLTGCGSDTDTGDDNLGVLDEDRPTIILEKDINGNSDIELSLGEQTIPGFSVRDAVDDDELLAAAVVVNSNVDFTRVGEYTITYSVTDSDGFTDTKTRRVTIVAANADVGSGNPQGLGGFDLGDQVGGGTGSVGSYSTDIDGFTSWYYDVCGGNFNASLYNTTTGAYNGTVSCANVGLDSIDLTPLSVFSTINGLDLSGNNLTSIDFNQLGLEVNNVKILKVLKLSNNNFSYIDFTPLHNLKNIDELWIDGNSLDYDTEAKRDALYKIFNNKSFTIYF